jgi:hypothetical protein
MLVLKQLFSDRLTGVSEERIGLELEARESREIKSFKYIT